MRVIIIGGGVGGLTLAIALRRKGLHAELFERAGDVTRSQLGAGLMLSYNATRVLRHLGLGEELETVGYRYQCSEFRTQRGEVLARWSVPENDLQVGVARANLHRMLLGALGEDTVHLGSECTGFRQDASGATALFADGREARGDVLVGVDGLKGAIRPQLLGPEKPRYAGYTVWRGLAAVQHEAAPPGLFRMSWGAGKRFAFYHVAPGLIYWFGVANAPEGEREPRGTRRGGLLERFGDWVEPTCTLISATPEENIHRTDIYDRRPVGKWGEGRVTLLGDAAHPMTFNLGQGACQAIESAAVLAECLSAGREEPIAALRAYEERRKDRTAGFTKLSWRMGAIGRVRQPGAVWLRDRGLKLIFGRVLIPRQEKARAIELSA
jgi:2-polyprenyl-6-methoxyphenol hydroxylase-like FAD-dependent oxidoreductase